MGSSNVEICVLGAGVVGLSTAFSIQQSIPNSHVTVIADKFLSDTLSFGAGGLFRPEVNIGKDRETIRKWALDSYERFSYLAQSDPNSGNSFVSGYQISEHSAQSLKNELVELIIPDKRDLSESELSENFPAKFKYGIFWTSIITDPRHYLPYLQEKITQQGGVFIKQHIESFEELFASKVYDFVVNCTGLEAAKLTDDHFLTPVRGQTLKVKAPWITNFYFADGAYIIPGRDYITLGGIKDYGNSNLAISELDRHSILTRCIEIVPSLEKVEIVFEWVGLRPQRQPVRVEYEKIQLSNGTFGNIVHNYGHGGHGVTLSWGTALNATQLILENLNRTV